MGTYYLLFDSGCTKCSNLARQIEELSSNALTIKSLRDAEVQATLTQVKSKWEWEPMLMHQLEDGNI